ncbi:alpha/beta hydrolase [Leifsonia sp. AG29]|uniref:alpha/beta hydrolase n=1 Tax=Leifsonia sp. AG29 TaxID=2598860 RepID=UPI00131E2511|nr:alpha/beta hydrolase-fold protein [Leifsonia sp. AG29]
MAPLVWLSTALAVVCAYPAWRFVRRAVRFRAGRSVRAVVVSQMVALGLLAVLGVTAPRPDLAGPGWAAIGLAATLLPLAIGDALQSGGGARSGDTVRRRPFVVRAAIAVVAGALTASIAVIGAAPAFASVEVAGRRIPVDEKTLADGYQLTVPIPPTASGFASRDAHLFVPPGWIADPSTARPIVTMMMGQPGRPTLGATLDALHSLGAGPLDDAPFVLVVDQLGSESANPPCSDTPAGKLETFLSKDVPAWIRSELPVSPARADWAIAGYSHGGECAAYLAASHPAVWGNVIDISGPDRPGEYRSDRTRDRYYAGSESAYERVWPQNVLASRSYAGTPIRAVFVAGGEDDHFRPQVEATATAAEKAGWKVTYWAVPGQSHSGATVTLGLETAYNQLIPGWLASGAIRPAADRPLCQADQDARACGITQIATVAGMTAIGDFTALAVFLVVGLLVFFSALRSRPGAVRPGAVTPPTPRSD